MRKILPIVVVALLAPLGNAQPAEGQSTDFSSSMTAFCYTWDCSVVQFDLSLSPEAYVYDIWWTSFVSGISFDGTVESETGFWDVNLFADGIQLNASSDPELTPAWFRLGMSGVGSATDLTTGDAIGYSGSAWATKNDNGTYSDQVSFGGHVTPEPETWAMLLTGLGIIGFGVIRGRIA